jgi:hypothetical protein
MGLFKLTAVILLLCCSLADTRTVFAQGSSDRDIAKSYARFGLDAERDAKMIATFRAVQLSAEDYGELLRRRWSPFEILTAAARAKELGFEGREAISEVIGMSDEEMDLWRAYQKASSDAERREIKSKIDAIPPARFPRSAP